jgi:hypothetical protein
MKHLLRGAALVALLAIFQPALAQAPDASSKPASDSAAPAASQKPASAPDAAASKWVEPRPKRHVRRTHRYARPHLPPYGSPYYWDYRWASPADHAANDLNAGIVYGNGWGWGWGWGPYGRTTESYN